MGGANQVKNDPEMIAAPRSHDYRLCWLTLLIPVV